jgi:hypothetical protein
MNVRSLIVGAVIAIAPIAIHAQTGFYLNPIATRVSNSVADSGLYAFLGQNSKSEVFWGINFGAYHDFKTTLPFNAGVDMRYSIQHGDGAALNQFLTGLRLSKSFGHLKPYIEPAVGASTTRAPFTVPRFTDVEYGILGGLDYTTHHHVDFRLFEVGYTAARTASSETIGGIGNIPASNFITISTGIVFRFP